MLAVFGKWIKYPIKFIMKTAKNYSENKFYHS
jgi:hypothetical protein